MTTRESRSQDPHHECGPSSLGRRFRCPGSLREERWLPDTTGAAAVEGTRLHEYTAEVLGGNLRLDSVPEDDQHLVRLAVCFAQDQLHCDSGEYPTMEDRLSLAGSVGDVITYGTADAIHEKRGTVYIVDHKFGRKPLDEASATLQISAYLAAALQRSPDIGAGIGWLYQPRTGATYRAAIDRAELPAVIERIQAVISRAEDPDAPLVTGEHCQYCRALGLCAETQRATREISELVPAAIDETTQRRQKSAIVEEIKSWPAAKIAGLMHTVEIARMAVDAVRSRLRECLDQDPESVPGYRLRESNGPRSASPVDVWQHLEDLGLSTPEFLECCSLSVAKVEKKTGADVLAATLSEGTIRQPKIRKLERTRS